MKPWTARAHEERHLLNPAFCTSLLWAAARGAAARPSSARASLSYLEAFLVLPLVLHQKTRKTIPNTLASSLPVWINAQPLIVASLPNRARSLVPYTKEAIFFGGCHRLIEVTGDQIFSVAVVERTMNSILRRSSEEVRACVKKAEFVGKWFAHTGAPETIFTFLGIRP